MLGSDRHVSSINSPARLTRINLPPVTRYSVTRYTAEIFDGTTCRKVVPDARSKAVRRRVAKQVAGLDRSRELSALRWTESVSARRQGRCTTEYRAGGCHGLGRLATTALLDEGFVKSCVRSYPWPSKLHWIRFAESGRKDQRRKNQKATVKAARSLARGVLTGDSVAARMLPFERANEAAPAPIQSERPRRRRERRGPRRVKADVTTCLLYTSPSPRDS